MGIRGAQLAPKHRRSTAGGTLARMRPSGPVVPSGSQGAADSVLRRAAIQSERTSLARAGLGAPSGCHRRTR
eukprot:5428612-Pyramimonas_sp.AAC.1